MNRKRILYIVVCGIILLSIAIYGIHVYKLDEICMTDPAPPMEELIHSIVHEGDKESYDDLSKFYPKEVLPYAFYMANEYNYGKAYFDVYHRITSIYSIKEKVNDESCKIAMAYLKKGAELGDASCLMSMSNALANGIYCPQDSTLAFHYAYLLYKDSTVAEKMISSGISVGQRVKQIQKQP